MLMILCPTCGSKFIEMLKVNLKCTDCEDTFSRNDAELSSIEPDTIVVDKEDLYD
jgi:hypothetical protein